MHLMQFEITDISDSFDSEEFTDVKYLKKYLKLSDDKSKAINQFDQIIKIVDSFSQIRAEAENYNKDSNYIYAYNKERQLPIPWNIINILINPIYNENEKEPPNRLIYIIAKENFNNIKQLSTNLRKVLNRKREMVPINRVQQLDAACLRWLTVQPGYTTAEKAGNKQKVLSIVRTETYNTLENRVFKDFLHLCISECRRYIEEYSIKFPNSQKVKEVRRFQNLAISILSMPIFDSVSKIVNTPKPNYVLQNNPSYKIIWDLYKKLLRKTKLLEIIWPNRQFIMEQYINIAIINIIRLLDKRKWNNYFFNNPWIFLQPQDNKVLISNYLDNECVIAHKNKSYFIALSMMKKKIILTVQFNKKIIKKYILKNFFIYSTIKDSNDLFNFIDVELIFRNYIYIIYLENETIDIDFSVLKNRYIVIKSNDDVYQKLSEGLFKIFATDLGDINV
jgi:hypothetical protein